jgi:Tol biopolymer transport system component
MAVVVAAAVLLAWQMSLGPDAIQAKPVFKRLTFRSGTIPSAFFAPDGQTIIYAAGYEGEPVQVYRTTVEGPGSRSLGLGPSGVWSVSSRGTLALSIGCRLHWRYCTGTLAEMSLSGGAPRELLENVEFADWDPEGENLAVVRTVEGVYRIEYPIGEVIFTTDGWITDLAFSPNGQWIAFSEHPVIGLPGGNLSIVDRQGERKILSKGWKRILGLAWTPKGDEVWFNAYRQGQKGNIMAIDLSGTERHVYSSGPEFMLTDIAPDGRALLSTIEPGSRMVGLTPGNSVERDYSWFDWSTLADLSHDGSTILFYEWGAATEGKPTIYVRPSDGSDAVRLGEGKPLALSPDGSWALAIQGDPPQLVVFPTGPGSKIPLDRSGLRDFYAAKWLPDGDRVLFIGEGEDYIPRTYLQDIDGGPPTEILDEGILGAIVSPDGRRVAAYGFDGSFHLCEISDGTCIPLHGPEPGDRLLQWSDDGETIFLRGPSHMAVDLFRLDLASSRRSPWKSLAPSDQVGMMAIDGDGVRLTPDGESYVYTYWKALYTLYLVEGLQ